MHDNDKACGPIGLRGTEAKCNSRSSICTLHHLTWYRLIEGDSWLTSGVIALLTGPHQTSFSELGSFTIRLSSGDRPVLAPEYAVKAPVDVMAVPVSYTRASS